MLYNGSCYKQEWRMALLLCLKKKPCKKSNVTSTVASKNLLVFDGFTVIMKVCHSRLTP